MLDAPTNKTETHGASENYPLYSERFSMVEKTTSASLTVLRFVRNSQSGGTTCSRSVLDIPGGFSLRSTLPDAKKLNGRQAAASDACVSEASGPH